MYNGRILKYFDDNQLDVLNDSFMIMNKETFLVCNQNHLIKIKQKKNKKRKPKLITKVKNLVNWIL